MAGTLNALGMLAIILVTIYSIVKYGHKPTGLVQILLGGLIAIALLFLITIFTTHMCYSGQPIKQPVITSLCYFLAWISAAGHKDLTVAEHARRHFRGLLWVITLLGFVLSFQYLFLVHEGPYTGNPKINRMILKINKNRVMHIRELLAKSVDSKKAFPKGWIVADDVFQLKLDPQDWHGITYIVHPLWHTWLTGIYGKRTTALELWYPGGKVEDAIEHIEYRRKYGSR